MEAVKFDVVGGVGIGELSRTTCLSVVGLVLALRLPSFEIMSNIACCSLLSSSDISEPSSALSRLTRLSNLIVSSPSAIINAFMSLSRCSFATSKSLSNSSRSFVVISPDSANVACMSSSISFRCSRRRSCISRCRSRCSSRSQSSSVVNVGFSPGPDRSRPSSGGW